ncbi:MAG: redox-regulated ATPase YchF [Dehalococcoidia bacterium]|nr:redox-regulated ATPase YchF [Dehalococcoidia bacterium]
MKIAILGLPKSGKSTIFNCLTNQIDQKTNSFGIMKVPDNRVEELSKLSSSIKTSFAELEIMDSESSQIFNDSSEFFSDEIVNSLQEFDAIILIIRSFNDPSVPHPFGLVEPEKDLEHFLLEQRFRDINMIEKRIEKIDSEKNTLNKKNQELSKTQTDLLRSLKNEFENGISFEEINNNNEFKKIFQESFFLSSIPTTIVFNIDENHIDENLENYTKDIFQAKIYGKLEEELLLLDKKEAEEIRQDLKINDYSIQNLVNQILKQNHIIHFLTTGEKDTKAWQIKSGSTAVESAQKIHSDISRGFIRAEVIHYSELLKSGSFSEAKKKGILRTEGKDYIVKNGDVINFLFSV